MKIDEQNTCPDQVINLCNELEVEVNVNDLVAAHPLPTSRASNNTNSATGPQSKSKPRRFIARFKNRSDAQRVLSNRKLSKNISPVAKGKLFSDASRGVAIQPNITSQRAALLGQVNDAVRQCSLDSAWIDTRNNNVMLRVAPSARPVPIANTVDLCLRVPSFKPSVFHLCVDPKLLLAVPDTAPCFMFDCKEQSR